MSGQIVCDVCMMKIHSKIHATAHQIVLGHETRVLPADVEGS